MNEFIPGHLIEATVNGEPAIIYLSLLVDGSNSLRSTHCWRYGPPSHEVLPDGAIVEVIGYLTKQNIDVTNLRKN
jgi:hypothetical protein